MKQSLMKRWTLPIAALLLAVLGSAGAAEAREVSQKKVFLECVKSPRAIPDFTFCFESFKGPFAMMIDRPDGPCWLGSGPRGIRPTGGYRLVCDAKDYTDLGPRHWFMAKSIREDRSGSPATVIALTTVDLALRKNRTSYLYKNADDGWAFSKDIDPELNKWTKYLFQRSTLAMASNSDLPRNQALFLAFDFPKDHQLNPATGPFERYILLYADPSGPYGQDQKKNGVTIVPIHDAAKGKVFIAPPHNTQSDPTAQEAQIELVRFVSGHRFVLSQALPGGAVPTENVPSHTVSLDTGGSEFGLTKRASDSPVPWESLTDELRFGIAPAGGHNGAVDGEIYVMDTNVNGAVIVQALAGRDGLMTLTFAPADGAARREICGAITSPMRFCNPGETSQAFRLFRSRVN